MKAEIFGSILWKKNRFASSRKTLEALKTRKFSTRNEEEKYLLASHVHSYEIDGTFCDTVILYFQENISQINESQMNAVLSLRLPFPLPHQPSLYIHCQAAMSLDQQSDFEEKTYHPVVMQHFSESGEHA